ncbi:ParB/RepB/Spo0J family partition protein [Jannaschia rubra]|uniref:Plasmid partitioning protein RepB n=1 Tax=Jannaschia rubra TaxID=282197 RepID=A0A0M6XSC2_9RHOB|nr:ParB N-terminal domain-containing protein [Jannaschia rubra]CTQ33143.1 plasmid partitioning protein RepB [Jannaschia rubra]SFG79462.1 ParB-like nuclease domain-containing protein [Jannaschia rubra]
MAKRRRLDIARHPVPETKEARPGTGGPGLSQGAAAAPAHAPPVAQVSGQAAGSAALEEMAAFITTARAEGRLLVSLPVGRIEAGYMHRDRLMPAEADEDMQALMASLRARGQQVPIDVVKLNSAPTEAYGLVSGLRRLTALRALWAETKDPAFSRIKARLVAPNDLPAAYVSMVEENEIRAPISFYERARIAIKAVEVGAFPDLRAALRGMYANVSRAKRSKIGSFAVLVEALDGALRFPAALPERRGLALARALEGDAALGPRLRAALAAARPDTPEAEAAALDAALRPDRAAPEPASAPRGAVEIAREDGRLILSGPGVDDAFHADLATWIAGRG